MPLSIQAEGLEIKN